MSQNQDLEKGLAPGDKEAGSIEANDTRPGSAINVLDTVTRDEKVTQQPHVAHKSLPPHSDNLSSFRYHLGIHSLPELVSSDGRPAPNVGIYKRVVQAEKSSHQQYNIFSAIINSALGLQIVFAAALTALGAGHGPHSAVTAFGALNTIIAGLLTFVKGSGLPNRLRYYENEWSKVREYIEQRERDFATGRNLDMDLTEEISIIEGMYENVRKDIEANTPDSYVSLSNMLRMPNMDPPPSLAKRGRYYEREALDQYSTLRDQGRRRAYEAQDEVESRINDFESRAQSRIADTQRLAETRMLDTQRQAESRIQDARQGAESHAKEMEEKVMMAAEKAAEKVLQFTKHRH